MTVRCKFQVSGIKRFGWDKGRSAEVELTTVYDSSIPEDQRFSDATPSGKLAFICNNPKALEQLELGEFYYIDIIAVPKEEMAAV
jgi:hypothetical protein